MKISLWPNNAPKSLRYGPNTIKHINAILIEKHPPKKEDEYARDKALGASPFFVIEYPS